MTVLLIQYNVRRRYQGLTKHFSLGIMPGECWASPRVDTRPVWVQYFTLWYDYWKLLDSLVMCLTISETNYMHTALIVTTGSNNM